MWILYGFLNFVSGNNSIIVIYRRHEWRQLEGKVGKARNLYSKWVYDSYLRNYYYIFMIIKIFLFLKNYLVNGQGNARLYFKRK